MSSDQQYLHLSIDYDEGEKGSYRGIVLKSDGEEVKRFQSDSPEADWASYLDYAQAHQIRVLESSSVTHFVFDNPEWRFNEDGAGREVLVPEDRSAWLEADLDV